MRRFKITNNLIGWTVFLIASAVYIYTLEPTASWWDCSEFIISAYKLEIGHPPGAPFHMILGRFFSLFASDVSKVAYMVNLLSALASAGTVMLLYFSIVHLARNLFSEQISKNEQIVLFGSGLAGSLAFAFTDSFWFSAVEGEVYALSSFFTAAVFWAILKWENEADQKFSNRWLVLIAYLIGLSIGVHLLNLLAIPAVALVYYFKKYRFSWKGFFTAILISGFFLSSIQYVLIPGIPQLAFLSDLLFVNVFRLPFSSGMLTFIVLLTGLLVWGIRFTQKNNLPLWNLAVTSVTVILIGYSSFALVMIRASANPPMNQNHPDDAYTLRSYLNREQYGDLPLIYGQYYNAPAIASKGVKRYYNQINGKYVVTGTTSSKTGYDSRMETFFPRMYSGDSRHIEEYKRWGNIKGKPVEINDGEETITETKPTFSENLRFFFNYQLGHMYFRYFLWNFAGRQNDAQGHGNFLNGNWISGIDFFDNLRIGPQDKLPEFMKNSPARNTYFFLPLIFGLTGLFFQYNHSRKGREGFAVVMALFIMTGIAIIVFLNQTPLQPRERDYAYVGSFYALSVWIGLSVPACWSVLKKVASEKTAAVTSAVLILVLVPGILFAQNLDDHNRSGRYMTRDYAINYLESCAPNAILFTYGDNDTFPLWYIQEVEGIRTDVKVINTSYLSMDWYISQHRRASYEAPPIPFSFSEEQYFQGIRDLVFISNRLDRPVDLREAMQFLGSDDERTKAETTDGMKHDYLPSDKFYLPVNRQKVLDTGIVQPEDAELIADTVTFSVNKRFLTKNEWAILNIIAAADWERPIYIDHSLIYLSNTFFKEWLQFEGLAYRFVPIKTTTRDGRTGHINTKILYDNVIDKFVWGNVNDPDIFLDDYNVKAIRIIQARYMFARLAEELVNEGENQKAEEVIDRMFELFPNEKLPLDYDSFPAIEQYIRAGAIEKGIVKARQLAENGFEKLSYYFSLPGHLAKVVHEEQEREMGIIQNLLIMTKQYNLTELNSEIDTKLQTLISRLSEKAGS